MTCNVCGREVGEKGLVGPGGCYCKYHWWSFVGKDGDVRINNVARVVKERGGNRSLGEFGDK